VEKYSSKPPPGPAKPTATPASPEQSPRDKSTGRVKFDDRGNAIWEWSMATGKFGTDPSSGRLKKLENPALAIVDDAPDQAAPGKPQPRNPVAGYNPYESGEPPKAAPVKSGQKPKKKDLRRLGEWITLRKQSIGKKDRGE
jgi:hypothetical protein